MTDEDYAKWKHFQDAAAEALVLAERKRRQEAPAEWGFLFRRAVILQELAVNFAKSVIR